VTSVQRGTVTLDDATDTATITAVDTARSVVHFLGTLSNSTAGQRPERAFTHVVLTNATTVTVTRGDNSGQVIVSYAVVEYAPGTIAVQRGAIALSGTGATATIAAVITARSYLMYGGVYGDTTSALWERTQVHMVLTNATTITATRGDSTDNAWIAWQCITW
jgi:hypothetical protein